MVRRHSADQPGEPP